MQFSFLIPLGWNSFVATVEVGTRRKWSSMIRIRNYKVRNLPTDSVPSYFSVSQGTYGPIVPTFSYFLSCRITISNRRRDDKGASREFIDFGLQSPLSSVSFISLPFWLLSSRLLNSTVFRREIWLNAGRSTIHAAFDDYCVQNFGRDAATIKIVNYKYLTIFTNTEWNKI